MSTSIEFDRVVFRLESQTAFRVMQNEMPEAAASEILRYETRNPLYMVFVQQGSNNSIATIRKNGRDYQQIARHWAMAMIGHEYDVIRRAIEWAREVYGGMLRFYGSRDLTPEAYIRTYRHAVAEAVPTDASRRQLHGRRVRFTADEGHVYVNAWLCIARKQGRLTDEPPRYGDGTGPLRDFTLSFGDGEIADADAAALANLSRQTNGVLWFTPSEGLEATLQATIEDRQNQKDLLRLA